MPLVERVWRQPQSLWIRKALFQIHLWTGIATGLYMLLIGVTGSFVVFRAELFELWSLPPLIINDQATARMTEDQLKGAAQRTYPQYKVTDYWEGKNQNQAVDIWLENDESKVQPLFNPYTGEDLGASIPFGLRLFSWMLDLHVNLLAGETGRIANAVGGVLLTLLGVTGMVVWWPGIRNWRRSLGVRWKPNWKVFNWRLHSALGFWTLLLILLWGISGIYVSYPQPFHSALDYFDPPNDESVDERLGDVALRWTARLHFGRFAGVPVKVLFVVLGLAPAALFVTGGLMWWNRVLRPAMRRSAESEMVRPDGLALDPRRL